MKFICHVKLVMLWIVVFAYGDISLWAHTKSCEDVASHPPESMANQGCTLLANSCTSESDGFIANEVQLVCVTGGDIVGEQLGYSDNKYGGSFASGDTVPPMPPIITGIQPKTNRINLSWTNPSGADVVSFRIYAGTSPGPTQLRNTPIGHMTTNATIGALSQATWFFRMTAIDTAGNESLFSNEVSAFPLSRPDYYGLIAHYPFDGYAADHSGNFFDANNNGATGTVDRFGLPNGAYHFDGINDHVVFEDSAQVSGYDDMSLSLWFKWDGAGAGIQQALLADRRVGLSAVDAYMFRLANGTLDFFASPFVGLTANEIQTDVWTHVVMVNDSSEGRVLYVNGSIVDSDSSGDFAIGEIVGSFVIGARIGFSGMEAHFAGDIDDIRIYNIALTSAQVDSLFRLDGWPLREQDAPSSPIELSVSPSGWSAQSTYSVEWTNPVDHSGIAAAFYTIDQEPNANNLGTRIELEEPSMTFMWNIDGIHTLWMFLEDSSGNYDPSNADYVLFKHDHTPPRVVHDNSVVPTWNSGTIANIPIEASATDALSGMRSLDLDFRPSGTAWLGSPIVPFIKGIAVVPNSFIELNASNGVDYRIVASDSAENTSRSPVYSLQLYLDQSQSRGVDQPAASLLAENEAVKAYRMLSIPLDLDNKSPQDLLINHTELGDYDSTEWRFFAYNRSRPKYSPFDDYPEIATAQIISPGKAFFLIMSSAQTIKTGPGSVLRADSYAIDGIPLQSGWNLVGNPFAFDVPLDSLVLSNGVSLMGRTWYYDGNGPNSGWTPNPGSIRAWEGIALNMGTQGPAFLRFNLTDRSSQAAPSGGLPTTAKVDGKAKSWKIKIDVTRGDNQISDVENIAAIDPVASDGWDQFDMFEPPLLGSGSVSLSFESEEGALTHDYRRSGEEGYVWDFKVLTLEHHLELDLKFSGLEDLPHLPYLFDLDWKLVREIKSDEALRISSRFGTRRLRIVVGSKEFAEENSLGISFVPENIVFFDNYPNPFNPTTSIDFILPRDSHVKVRIFNILGEQVKLLHEGHHVAGRLVHTEFDASALMSGIYFAVLEYDGGRMVKKMLLVK